VEPLVAIMDRSNASARRPKVSLRELAATTAFIDCHHDSGLRTQVDLAFSRADTTRHVSFELGNLLDVARIASLGLGAAIVPSSIADSVPRDGDGHFVIRGLSDRQALQPVTLVSRPPGALSHAARAFVDRWPEWACLVRAALW
jgi:DNA-binding transcriptional LysR family regulator